jgi:hypothetical protein
MKKILFIFSLFSILLNFNVEISNDSLFAERAVDNTGYFQKSSLDARCIVKAKDDELLGNYERSDREFLKIEIGNRVVYFHQRKIGKAVVEKDFIIYQFDKESQELVDKIVQWRSDLPQDFIPILTREAAESMVEGEVLYSTLYFISPESDVFPLTAPQENPCWLVRSIKDGDIVITIVDAMNGTKLGYGIPPPYDAFSLSGPVGIFQGSCSGSWAEWYLNARDWFNAMGYSTNAIKWPARYEIQSAIQNPQMKLFFEIAHGDHHCFYGGCSNGSYEFTLASDIEYWISSFPKKKFVFIGSCGGMCDTGDGSLSYEFRKGSSVNTVTVGYCGMATEACENCWVNSIEWQNQLFQSISQGNAVKMAFDSALATYPMCHDCVRFAGDISLVLVSTYTLNIKAGTGGTTHPSPGAHNYMPVAQVTITAIPNPYYDFKNWSGDASGRSYTITVTMDSNKFVMAHFTKINPPLNFSAQKVYNYSFSQDEYINVLTWQANPDNEYIQKYRLYKIEDGGKSLLAEFDSTTFQYWHRNVKKDKRYTYALAAVNDRTKEGESASISVQ